MRAFITFTVSRTKLVSLVLLALSCATVAQTTQNQTTYPCLGCAQHEELKNRWRKPWLYTVLAHATIAATGYVIEEHGKNLGLCERTPFLRSSQSINGCHPFSAKRAIFVGAPLEALLFTSPSWGISRWGHPRIGLAIEFIPIALHTAAIVRTEHSIHRYHQLTGQP